MLQSLVNSGTNHLPLLNIIKDNGIYSIIIWLWHYHASKMIPLNGNTYNGGVQCVTPFTMKIEITTATNEITL